MTIDRRKLKDMEGISNRLHQLQLIIDTSDPFLLEEISGKSDEELIEMIDRLYYQLSIIPEENYNRKEYQKTIIETAEAVLEARMLSNDDGDRSVVFG